VDVARISEVVSIGFRRPVATGTVAVAVGAAASKPGLRMTARMLHRLRNNNRLRQPATIVPARLEFNNLLMAFIP